MKLYYAPGACSQAPHIILHETGLSHEAVKVDLKQKRTEHGRDYREINPKGSVPALELDNGEVLTENAVVLQYLGDRTNLGEFLPSLGDFRRYRVLEWLNFITTELHKSFAPLFSPAAGDEVKSFMRKTIGERLDFVEAQFTGPFLTGDDATLPDFYLFVITGWAEKMIGLDKWPKLAAFQSRMLERPAVRAVLRHEGLLQEEAAS
ncbi:glutathione transferase GstA [Sphingomonas sp. HDW15A]|uniref:glutathione transferase GstA n=1 Tax=Sphingomonas sp. HDW15A TaxID=2714942 RepID=UPI00140DF39C|nr:glutathione transferase GstA [Sphingomonas sp. HDW15A]QIK95447.1 glutathione transferase GstA [Sphingomonas sp. HDW15A]